MSYWGWLTTWSRTCAGPWPTTGWIGGCGSTWRPSCSSSTSSASGPTTEWRCWATRSSPRPSWTGCCTTATSSTSEARATGLAGTANPAGPEILALALDPANIGPAGRFWDCLYQAADVLGAYSDGFRPDGRSVSDGAAVPHLLGVDSLTRPPPRPCAWIRP